MANGVRGPFPGAPNPMMMQQGGARPDQQMPNFRVGPNGQPVPVYVQPVYNDYQQGRMQQQRFYQNRPNQIPQQRKKDDAPQSLAQIVAQIPQEQQKNYLGNQIYQKITESQKVQDPNVIGKITGMFLSMEIEQIISLLEDENVFDQQLTEAMNAYMSYKTEESAEAAPAEAAASTEAEAAPETAEN
jgi:polyadenylate-binding protein